MKEKDEFSITKGMSFIFEDEGNKIVARFSALTGMERIYLNGDLLSSKRSISRRSDHKFTVKDSEYLIKMDTQNLLKGPFNCTLVKNGQPLTQKSVVFDNKNNVFRYIIIILAGTAIGFTSALVAVPKFIFYPALAIFSLCFFLYGIKSRTPKIVEINFPAKCD